MVMDANWKVFLQLAYILPSLVLNCAIIYTIFFGRNAKKNFNSFFWTLYAVIFASQIGSGLMFKITVWHMVPFMTRFMLLFENCPSLWPTLFAWITIAAFYNQRLTTVTLTFNRLSVFTFEHRYKKFWSSYGACFIIGTIVASFALTWNAPALGYEIFSIQATLPNGSAVVVGYHLNTRRKFNFWRTSMVQLGVCFATTIVSFVLNMVTFFKMAVKSKLLNSSRSYVQHKHERQLCFFSLLTFITDLIFAFTFMVYILPLDDVTKNNLMEFQNYAYDADTFLSPWMLVSTCKMLRAELLRVCRRVQTFSLVSNNGNRVESTGVRITTITQSKAGSRGSHNTMNDVTIQ